jgi:hypothetical protein
VRAVEFCWLRARNRVAHGGSTSRPDASSVHCSVVLCRLPTRHREGDDFMSTHRVRIRRAIWTATHRLLCLTPAFIVRVVYVHS